MSTKNLARTVIEGGRHRVNRGSRRYSNQQERVAERQLSNRVARLDVPESAIYQPRQPVYRFFDDKLGPAKRWLRRQIGRPWDKIRGELTQRFDTRTTSGRHILFCHLIPSVRVDDVVHRHARYDFEVDRHGILRDARQRRNRLNPWLPRLLEPKSIIVEWLGARKVGARDQHLYWFTPTAAGVFRQGRELDETEAARWRALPEWFRGDWDIFKEKSVEETIQPWLRR